MNIRSDSGEGLGYTRGKDQLLRFEFASPGEVKFLTTAINFSVGLSLTLVILWCILRSEQRNDSLLLAPSRTISLLNIIFASITCTFCVGMLFYAVYDCFRAFHARLRWTRRRWRLFYYAVAEYFVALAFVSLSIPASVVPYLEPCRAVGSPFMITVETLRSTFLSIHLLIMSINARNSNIRPDLNGPLGLKDAINIDAPQWQNWVAWVPFLWSELFVILIAAKWSKVHKLLNAQCAKTGPGSSGYPPPLECGSWQLELTTYLILRWIGTIFQCLFIVFFTVRGYRQLARVPYLQWRSAWSYLMVQVQFRALAILFVCLLSILYFVWFEGCNPSSSAGTFLEAYPIMGFIGACNLFTFLPKSPKKEPIRPSQVQVFAWTEGGLPGARQRRTELAGDPRLDNVPMFCFELALKCFYWSNIVYYMTETGAANLLDRDTGRGDASISKALALFRLNDYKLFYDVRTSIHLMVAWNIESGTILLSVRGTWGKANVLTDLTVFRVPHPPKRGSRWKGTRPYVHAGFLRAWRKNALNVRVVQLIFSLINSEGGPGPDAFRILCTGHSLGGAVASLAGFEIAKACGLKRSQVLVYTFGCPRVGNGAFVREFNATVPECWHVINAQDVVAKSGKKLLLNMYKRHGNRVFISKLNASVIPSPGYLEFTLFYRYGTASVQDHYLDPHRDALRAIVLRELSKEGLPKKLELKLKYFLWILEVDTPLDFRAKGRAEDLPPVAAFLRDVRLDALGLETLRFQERLLNPIFALAEMRGGAAGGAGGLPSKGPTPRPQASHGTWSAYFQGLRQGLQKTEKRKAAVVQRPGAQSAMEPAGLPSNASAQEDEPRTRLAAIDLACESPSQRAKRLMLPSVSQGERYQAQMRGEQVPPLEGPEPGPEMTSLAAEANEAAPPTSSGPELPVPEASSKGTPHWRSLLRKLMRGKLGSREKSEGSGQSLREVRTEGVQEASVEEDEFEEPPLPPSGRLEGSRRLSPSRPLVRGISAPILLHTTSFLGPPPPEPEGSPKHSECPGAEDTSSVFIAGPCEVFEAASPPAPPTSTLPATPVSSVPTGHRGPRLPTVVESLASQHLESDEASSGLGSGRRPRSPAPSDALLDEVHDLEEARAPVFEDSGTMEGAAEVFPEIRREEGDEGGGRGFTLADAIPLARVSPVPGAGSTEGRDGPSSSAHFTTFHEQGYVGSEDDEVDLNERVEPEFEGVQDTHFEMETLRQGPKKPAKSLVVQLWRDVRDLMPRKKKKTKTQDLQDVEAQL